MDTEKVINRLYPKATRRPRFVRDPRSTRLAGWTMVFVALVYAVGQIYYYNRLVDLEYNVDAAWAQVEAQQQRRYHIQKNLTRLVVGYRLHEAETLSSLTQMRTGRTPPAEGNAAPAAAAEPSAQGDVVSQDQIDKLLARIQVVAEQYPQLRLTENIQQFSASVIESEKEIARLTIEYNNAVNIYTTMLHQFPGKVFGKIVGFKTRHFYKPDAEKLSFHQLDLDFDKAAKDGTPH